MIMKVHLLVVIIIIIIIIIIAILTYLLTPWSRVLLEKLTSKLCR